MDYQSIGFKAGLEIHQQLETHKLFCGCKSKINESPDFSFQRQLRPTQSELGDVDIAALKEAQKNRRFLYTASNPSTCLVEADEEPPHAVNPEAVDVCLTIAVLLNAKPVDEIQFMRKLVIDGSNTSGFQRTALVATGGKLQHVSIQTIALEEDAARKITEKDQLVTYGLDRLGIPLIEIATGAEIRNPLEARDIAEKLGMLLKATGKVKHDLGTIRQDLNVSIAKGARVEIKGIQSLSSISRVAEVEVLRQLGILEIQEILQKRVQPKDFDHQTSHDLLPVFQNTQSNLVNTQIKKKGVVRGIRLSGFDGLLKRTETRLGRDLAVYARIHTGIGGIIHSDEIPGYGITENEIQNVTSILKLTDTDAFIIALGSQDMVTAALQAVVDRAKMFLNGVPEEVRRSLQDDTTEYMRPLPGAARMYPETDVPPLRITTQLLKKITADLPELPEEKHERFLRDYHLNNEQITQLFSSGYEHEFEQLAKQFPDHKNTILRVFLNTIPELINQNISIENLNPQLLAEIFSRLSENTFAKEAIPTILICLLQQPQMAVDEAITTCGLQETPQDQIVEIIKKIIRERQDFVKQKGTDAVGPLMGLVMKELRGKADGKLISKLLQQQIEKIL